MKKIDIAQEGMKAQKVQYDVYCKLFGENLIKLNLTACENSKISISVPIKTTENLESLQGEALQEYIDKLNISSRYYNDICYTTTSEDGTDISIKDRQINYIEGDMIVCQEDCYFAKLDLQTFKVECSCKVKESSSSIIDMNFNKDKLFENFKNIKNFANFNFLVCYKKLFNKKGIKKNIGCYLTLAIIFFHILTIIIFYLKQFLIIKMKIKAISFGINEYEIIEENTIKRKKKLKIRKRNNINIIKNDSDKNEMLAPKKIQKRIKRKKKKSKIVSQKQIITTINIINNNINNKTNIIYSNNLTNRMDKNNIITNKIQIDNNKRIEANLYPNNNNKDDIEKIKNIMKYIDEEVNTLSYDLALQYDKRTYWQYYLSLLKTKHNLIFALFNGNDYNSRIIKIDLFFIGFSISYFVNGLFYDDDTMHKIYKSKGRYNLEAKIPIIIYSTMISSIFKTLLTLLALSNDAIISFKQNKSKINLMKREEDLLNKLTIKFILYFIICFLFLVFFWYYISLFCVIYKNTQIHLLKDTLMSFGLSLLIPFGIYLLPGLFRIPALSSPKKRR